MTEGVWTRSDVEWIDIAGEVVTLANGALTRLDVTASAVWKLLDEPAHEADLAFVLARSTGASYSDVANDLAQLFQRLAHLGVVHPLPA